MNKITDVHSLWKAHPEIKLRCLVMTHNSIAIGSLRNQQAASLLSPMHTQWIWAAFREEAGRRLGWARVERVPNAYYQAAPPYGQGADHPDDAGAQTHLSRLASINAAPAAHAQHVVRTMQRGLEVNGQCDRTMLPFGGAYRFVVGNRVRHGMVEHTLTSLERLQCFASLSGGACKGRGPLLYERKSEEVPKSVKGKVTVVHGLTRQGAWLELWRAGGHVIPCVPLPTAAARYCRAQRIHHLSGLFDRLENGTWVQKPEEKPDPFGVVIEDAEGMKEIYEWIHQGF
eukprot:gene13076-20365_t